jgi:hypothetical protein
LNVWPQQHSQRRTLRVFSARLSGDRGRTAAAAEGPWSSLQGPSQSSPSRISQRRKRWGQWPVAGAHSLTSQCRDKCQHTVRQCQATNRFGLCRATLGPAIGIPADGRQWRPICAHPCYRLHWLLQSISDATASLTDQCPSTGSATITSIKSQSSLSRA